MTVEKLIEKLKQMPQDKKVYFYVDNDHQEINVVFIDEDGDVGLMD
jgi:hypothetical protein